MGEELNGLREPIAEPASSGQQHPADNPLAVDAEAGVDLATASPVADRTIRLFEFLKRAQQLKTTTVHTVDQYERDGEVLWFADFPLHAALSSACRSGDPEPDDVLLIVDRVPRLSPPMPPDDLSSWLDGKVDDPERSPVFENALRSQLTTMMAAHGKSISASSRLSGTPMHGGRRGGCVGRARAWRSSRA